MGGMSSCNEKWEIPTDEPNTGVTETGTLSLADFVLDVVNAEQINHSRAGEDFSNYKISIINKATTAVENEWKYSEMPGLPVFNTGNYTLKVESCELQRAEWDAPYFVGTKDFTINKDEITNIGTVTCKLQNLKVTVVFEDDLIAAAGDDVQCEIQTVSSGTEDGYLIYGLKEKRAGYFELLTGSSTMLAKFTGTVNGYHESFVEPFVNLKPGQHYNIIFRLRTGEYEIPEATGNMNFGSLNIDMSVVDHDMTHSVGGEEGNISGNRPGQEEWPGGPVDPGTDPTGPDVPTPPTPGEVKIDFTSDYLNLKDGAVNLSTEFGTEEWGDDLLPAVVNITAENGVKDLVVKIESPSLDVTEVGLDNEFSLVNPKHLEAALKGLGFPVGDEVRNQKSVEFNISGFIPLLGTFDGVHKFTITVTDNADAQKVQILRFSNE